MFVSLNLTYFFKVRVECISTYTEFSRMADISFYVPNTNNCKKAIQSKYCLLLITPGYVKHRMTRIALQLFSSASIKAEFNYSTLLFFTANKFWFELHEIGACKSISLKTNPSVTYLCMVTYGHLFLFTKKVLLYDCQMNPQHLVLIWSFKWFAHP